MCDRGHQPRIRRARGHLRDRDVGLRAAPTALTNSGYPSRVAIAIGLLKTLLEAALSAQVQRKVIRALGWSTARVSFVEAFGLVDVDVRHATPIEPLVLAALRVAPLSKVEELFVQARSRFPALRTDGIAGAS